MKTKYQKALLSLAKEAEERAEIARKGCTLDANGGLMSSAPQEPESAEAFQGIAEHLRKLANGKEETFTHCVLCGECVDHGFEEVHRGHRAPAPASKEDCTSDGNFHVCPIIQRYQDAYEDTKKEHEERVTSLQQRCNKLLMQSRGVRYQVDEFHERFGYDRPRKPVSEFDEELVRFRLRLIVEECLETVEAALDVKGAPIWKEIQTFLGVVIENRHVKMDFPEFIDGLADLDYVVEGTRISFGVDGRPIAAEVHRANMDKTPKTAENTKVTKPPGWKPPDIEGELRKQGWVKCEG